MLVFPFNNNTFIKANIAIVTECNLEITYQQLAKQVSDLSKSIRKRSLCLIVASNNYETLVLYLACLKANSIALIVDYNTKESNLKNIIKKFTPNYLFLNSKSIVLSNQKYKKHQNNIIKNFHVQENFLAIELNEKLAILLTTSGSTGTAKFVKLSYDNLLSNVSNIASYLDMKKNECTITNLPFNYAYGLSVINTHLFMGGKLLLTEKSIIDKSALNLLKYNNITNFNAVPYTYDIMFKFKLQNYYLKNLRFITQAGGKLSKDSFLNIIKSILKYKTSFFIMYGQTEASPRMAYYKVKNKNFVMGMIGKAIKEGRFSLYKDKKKINEPNIEGRLFYEGPNVFLGYAESHKDLLNSESVKRKLDTGDIARYDNNNDLIIVSRTSRFIKIEDRRVSLDDIENQLKDQGIDVICTGENKINIWHTNKNLNIKLIYEIIKEKFSLKKRTISFEYIKLFPKNSSGKILYNKLKK